MQETITVQYVNPPKPGKKKGSVKSVAGKTYGVWPDKLDLFQPGGTYVVEVEQNEFNGQTYYGVKRVIGGPPAGGSNGTAAPATEPMGARRQTDDATAERIYVCGIVNAAVPGLLDKGSLNGVALVKLTNEARQAWRQTFGDKGGSPIPNDDIGF